MERRILLTFDLEEFDLPLEYGCHISEEDQLNVSSKGLQRVISLLSKYNIPATFFTTAFYAEHNKEIIKNLAATHEIASHSVRHSGFKETDPLVSKAEIERITGKEIYGFRMPKFRKTDMSVLRVAGYRYDSSINPTYIPGRYNNLFSKRKIYLDSGSDLIEVPVSVSSLIRFPLFWLSFKNTPLPIYYLMCRMAMWRDSYLHLYFHPWEFDDLEFYNIPGYIKSPSGKAYSEKFEKLILKLKKKGDFSTVSVFLDSL